MVAPARAHIILPEELIAEVDKVAGKRKRSKFVEEAIRERLRRERMMVALEESAGVIDLADYPEWQTPEAVSEWVSRRRREDDEHRARRLERE